MSFCSNCGYRMQNDMKFCPECGLKLATLETGLAHEKAGDVRSSTVVIDRADPTYFSDEKGVRVTATRLIIPGKTDNEGPSTYAMANITSVKTEKHDPNRLGGILTAVVGLVLLAIGSQLREGTQLILIGVLLLGAGIAWAVLVKPTFHLRISSASGETDALRSKDKLYVDRVVTALNEALIKRG